MVSSDEVDWVLENCGFMMKTQDSVEELSENYFKMQDYWCREPLNDDCIDIRSECDDKVWYFDMNRFLVDVDDLLEYGVVVRR